MTISVFDLFSVGIGPSSSHTVGPMRAAGRFLDELTSAGLLARTRSVHVRLYGSLGATGEGHGTRPAVLLGLEGHRPELITEDELRTRRAAIAATGRIRLGGHHDVAMTDRDIELCPRTSLPAHPNGMTFSAGAGGDGGGGSLHEQTYYSTGGGFVRDEAEMSEATATGATPAADHDARPDTARAARFDSASGLLRLCAATGSPVSDVMLRFECTLRSRAEVRARLLYIREVMWACWTRGVRRHGELPGPLRVARRARRWHDRLAVEDPFRDPALALDWVNLVAMAVNEENASGGRVVTAPTNGAAGIVPAVLHYAVHYTLAGRRDPDEVAVRFLLTAGAIGSLYKERASISGAEVGCQGEVGSAASMAAAALAEILGGSPAQVENAAEIAMEHCLGLTCDPVAGLVQIPCIERNAISAGKALNAARMALRGDGTHRISLDDVIATMRATGRDMNAKYKETSLGGLAVIPVNFTNC